MTSVPFQAIGLSGNIKTNEINKITIEGKKYAMYRGPDNKVALIDNVCPHRGADLSKGKIVDGNVQCPYHGWEYNGDGKLVKVPSTGKAQCLKNGDINSYRVIEDGGFAWLVNSLGAETVKLPTRYCEELTSSNWVQVYGSKELKGNITEWLMNSADISHINYVHDFADEEKGQITSLKIDTHEDHIDCYAKVNAKASSSATEHMQPGTGTEIKSTFIAPNTTVVRIKLKDPYSFITFTTLVPIDDYKTKMTWCFLYPKIFPLTLPLVYTRFYNEMYKTVAQDEQIIKHLTDVGVPYTLNVPSDIFQLEVLKKLGYTH